MNRRRFLAVVGISGLGVAGCRFRLDEGIWNPCRKDPLPERLAAHNLVQAAWEGIDPAQTWDCHVHLIGTGDSDSGIWINPDMRSLFHPIQYAQRKFYLNAACADVESGVDEAFLNRLLRLHDGMAKGSRFMLLAFDYHYDTQGRRVLSLSSFHTPNEYARKIARRYPARFEWIASIHPYRRDAVAALEQAVKGGARAVKWLPPAMGMDPASPLCDPFYEAMARLKLPLLTHGGDEVAVHGGDAQLYGNPLRLRRPLDHGVRVIVAHCASLGTNIDIDKGRNGPRVANFALFSRLMDEPRYEGLLFGEISAMTQVNRVGPELDTVVSRTEWHPRLINGSDYPLPAVMPLFSMTLMVDRGYLTASEAAVLSEVRQYNPLLFDFALKRHLKVGGRRLDPVVFHSRRVF